jgi:RHS repeat-associated protein
MRSEYIYAGNLRLAIVQSGSTYYWHNDHISPRVRTDSSGNVADQRGTFPFGETWYTPSSAAPWVFTSYYRDVEADGNDYAQARTYVGGLGRFSSPDPVAGSISDPQSLNRYSYVRNMPVMLTDPFGTCPPVVQNHDNTDSKDTKAGGPSAADSSDGADAALEAPPQGTPGGCGTPVWYYTISGGGNDPFFGPGSGSIYGGSGSGSSSNGSSSGDGGGLGFTPGTGGGGGMGPNPLDDLLFGSSGLCSTFVDLGEGTVVSMGACGGDSSGAGGGGPFDAARQVVQTVLDGQNDCSKFFNNAPIVVLSNYFSYQIPDNYKTAGQFFRSDTIAYSGAPGQVLPVDAAAGVVTSTGQNGNATILIQPNSLFDSKTDTIGSFSSGRPAGQAIALLHELGHLLAAIESDSKSQMQSWTNTMIIDSHCRNAIIAALGGKY